MVQGLGKLNGERLNAPGLWGGEQPALEMQSETTIEPAEAAPAAAAEEKPDDELY